MSGRSKRRPGDSPVVDVADVFADDALVDALLAETGGADVGAAGRGDQQVGNGSLGGDPLIELFDIWRDEISSIPLPPAPAVRHASHAVAAGRHRQQRTARPAMLIAAAICALLIGSAAVGSRTAKPGDTLWPLASVLWSDRLASVHSLTEVKNALADVQTALDAGRPDAAREALMRATVQLGHVDDLDMPASIPATVQKLWVDVIPEAERRSTQATASAAAAANQAAAQPDGSSAPVSPTGGSPVATTPLLGTILEAIIASNQPQPSTDSPTPSAGSSAPARAAAVGPVTIGGPSTPAAAVDPSPDSSPAPSTDPTTGAPTASASPTPTPPPVTTGPAPQTAPAVPVDPTTDASSSGDQTSTENSAPAPPPASSEPSTHTPVPSVGTTTPTGTATNNPDAFGADSKAAEPAADRATATP